MKIELIVADYSNPKHRDDLLFLLNAYALDPMGGQEPLGDYTRENLCEELASRPHVFTILCYVDAEPAGICNCVEGFSTFRAKPLVSIHDIALLFDRHHPSIRRILTENGGIRPRQRKRSPLALTRAEREVISRGLTIQLSMREIASQLGRFPSTVSREIQRNGGYASYRASSAEDAAWQRALRPKACKLAGRPSLARVVTEKLQIGWSPEQIAGWLKQRYPDDKRNHVSHETIYKSLFIQARGVLKKELLACLRTQRTTRRPRLPA